MRLLKDKTSYCASVLAEKKTFADDMFTAIVPMTPTREALNKQGSGEADRQAAVHVESQDKGKLTPQVTPQVAPQVTPQVVRLLRIVRGEMSRTELMHALGLKDRMHFSDGYLAPALSTGFVERTIPDRPSSRLQKYRLTEKGKAALLSKPDGSTPA